MNEKNYSSNGFVRGFIKDSFNVDIANDINTDLTIYVLTLKESINPPRRVKDDVCVVNLVVITFIFRNSTSIRLVKLFERRLIRYIKIIL